jgi:hypothetical protein
MNNKKIIVPAVILAVGVAVIVLVNLVSNRKPSEEALQFFPGISEKTIGAVLLKDSQDMVKLQRKGDRWVMIPKQVLMAPVSKDKEVAGLSRAMGADEKAPPVPAGMSAAEFPADSGCIAQMVENIVKIKKNTQVSDNPANQGKYEVNEARGIRIEAFDITGKSMGAVILGKSADYSSNYFRPEKSNAVFLVLESSRWAFSTDNKRWTDKSIMKIDKALVKQLTIAKKGAPAIVIARGDTVTRGWHMLAPVKRQADSGKVDEILNSLSNFQAAEYEESALTDTATGLADPSIVVTVNFMSGTVRTLAIGKAKPGQNKYWVRVPEKQFVYCINDYEQKKFDKKPGDLEQAAPAPAPKAAIAPAPAAPAPAKKLNKPMQEKSKKAAEDITKSIKK